MPLPLTSKSVGPFKGERVEGTADINGWERDQKYLTGVQYTVSLAVAPRELPTTSFHHSNFSLTSSSLNFHILSASELETASGCAFSVIWQSAKYAPFGEDPTGLTHTTHACDTHPEPPCKLISVLGSQSPIGLNVEVVNQQRTYRSWIRDAMLSPWTTMARKVI